MMSLDDIKDRLNQDPMSALAWLLPNGKMIRHSFCCGDVYGKPATPGHDGSFKFNCRRLLGKDWADGDRGYNGIYDVFVRHVDGDQTKAIKLAREFLKLPVNERPQAAQGREPGSRRRDNDKIEVIKVITPAPETPPTIPERHRHALKGLWPWRTVNGELIGYTYRIEFTDRQTNTIKKLPLPLTWCHLRHRDTQKEWTAWHNAGLPKPQPLSDAELLANAQRILLVEGEKTRDAGKTLIRMTNTPLPQFDLAVTWYGGVERIPYVDWSPLAGKTVYSWPDADLVSSSTLHRPGMLAMEKIGKILSQLSPCPAYFIADPHRSWKAISQTSLPKGWDLADPIPAPGTHAWITETINNAERYL